MADGIKITFPKATLMYPALQRPDTKFDPLGSYKADIRLSKEDAKPLQARLQERAKAHTGRALKASENSLWSPVLDDEGNETGDVRFKIRVKNRTGKDGKTWDRRPLLIDAKKTPIDVNPWGGTIARVQAEVYEWEFGGKKGLSLQPLVVQIIELKSGSGNQPDLDDFEEEDGFAGTAADMSAFDDEGGSDSAANDEAGDY